MKAKISLYALFLLYVALVVFLILTPDSHGMGLEQTVKHIQNRDWLDYLLAFGAIVPIAPLAVYLWRKVKKRR